MDYMALSIPEGLLLQKKLYCVCAMYGTWYAHAGTVCILAQFSPQTVLSCQYTWCIHGGMLCSPISKVYLLCWITHLLEGRVSVDPV